MQSVKIEGPTVIEGKIKVGGAKNATLPVLVATFLSHDDIIINNFSQVSDVMDKINIMRNSGVNIKIDGDKLFINTKSLKSEQYNNVETYIFRNNGACIRTLNLFWGPLLATKRSCVISMPQGCYLGDRKFDLHLDALQKMGANFTFFDDEIYSYSSGLTAIEYTFPTITVGGTQNIVMAAVCATGKTILYNCATEPECVFLCEVLQKMGANISGIGTSKLIIDGCGGMLYTGKTIEIDMMPDRLQMFTYLSLPLIAGGGTITINNKPDCLCNALQYLIELGADIELTSNYVQCSYTPKPKIQKLLFTTGAYPACSTDLQPILCVLSCLHGKYTVIDETVFNDRFIYVNELKKMGANITIQDQKLLIHGIEKFKSSNELKGPDDIRGTMAVILAAISTKKVCMINNIEHINRGYENIWNILQELNCKIQLY